MLQRHPCAGIVGILRHVGQPLGQAVLCGAYPEADVYLSPKRNVAAAKRFLAKALRSNASAGYPRVINTDKAPSLARAIAELKSEGICPQTVEHRQVKREDPRELVH